MIEGSPHGRVDLAVAAPPPDAPLLARIRDTFLAPGRLAQHARATAPWLDVLLVSTAVALVAVMMTPDDIFVEQMRDAVSRRGRPVEITSSPAEVARWGRMIGLLATIGTHPLIAFVMAGVLTLTFGVVGGTKATFREYLSLSAHTMLIPAAGTLLGLVVGGMGGSMAIPWLGAYQDPTAAPNLLVAGLARLDPFLVWMAIAAGIGVHVLDPRRPRVAVVVVMLALYFLLVLATTTLLHPEMLGAGRSIPTAAR